MKFLIITEMVFLINILKNSLLNRIVRINFNQLLMKDVIFGLNAHKSFIN